MISYPNAKINLGLNIISKRDDGFHNIETVFYPVKHYDILEIIDSERFEFVNKGIEIDCPQDENLCVKAYNILKLHYSIPPVKIILYKNIRYGSGLGSASSNAAYTLKVLNDKFELKISDRELKKYASELGADCAFFIENKPLFAEGKGDVFSDVDVCLDDYNIKIIFPEIKINTKEAYKNCQISGNAGELKEIIKQPVEKWKDLMKNDFESSIFKKYKVLKEIKEEFYNSGAVYSQMSGSGSGIFGIFRELGVVSCAPRLRSG